MGKVDLPAQLATADPQAHIAILASDNDGKQEKEAEKEEEKEEQHDEELLQCGEPVQEGDNVTWRCGDREEGCQAPSEKCQVVLRKAATECLHMRLEIVEEDSREYEQSDELSQASVQSAPAAPAANDATTADDDAAIAEATRGAWSQRRIRLQSQITCMMDTLRLRIRRTQTWLLPTSGDDDDDELSEWEAVTTDTSGDGQAPASDATDTSGDGQAPASDATDTSSGDGQATASDASETSGDGEGIASDASEASGDGQIQVAPLSDDLAPAVPVAAALVDVIGGTPAHPVVLGAVVAAVAAVAVVVYRAAAPVGASHRQRQQQARGVSLAEADGAVELSVADNAV